MEGYREGARATERNFSKFFYTAHQRASTNHPPTTRPSVGALFFCQDDDAHTHTHPACSGVEESSFILCSRKRYIHPWGRADDNSPSDERNVPHSTPQQAAAGNATGAKTDETNSVVRCGALDFSPPCALGRRRSAPKDCASRAAHSIFRGTLIGQEGSEASWTMLQCRSICCNTHYTFLTNNAMLGAITVLLATNRNYVP